MEMSIDEIVETLSGMQMADKTLYNHLSDSDKHLIDKRNASLKRAIDVIAKYQMIEEIVKNTQQLCSYGSAFIDIREVVEDGKDD